MIKTRKGEAHMPGDDHQKCASGFVLDGLKRGISSHNTGAQSVDTDGTRMGSRKGDSRLNEMSNSVVDKWKASGKPWSEFKDSLNDEEKMYTQFGKIFTLYSDDPMMDSNSIYEQD